MKEDVIIIGSGIGGLTCGALLAAAGHHVTIYEKNSFIGGACSSYTKNGFTFDRSVHLFTSGLNGPYGELFNRLGLDTLQFVKHINKKTAIKIYNRGGYIPMSLNLKSLIKPKKASDKSKRSGDVKSSDKESSRRSSGNAGFSGKTAIDLGKIAFKILTTNKRSLARLYQNDITIDQWVKGITDDPMIYGLFAFLMAGMFATSPKNTSVAEFMYCFKKEMISRHGVQYPLRGGAQAIPDAIASGFKRFGGEIHLNSRVEGIVIENNKARGVYVNGERRNADIVISNLDIVMTVTKLIGSENLPADYVARIESLRPSLSAMTFKLALKEPLVKDWSFVNCYHPSLNDWGNRYGAGAPRSNGFFGPVLSNIDPSLAPPGCQSVIFGTIVPSKGPDWEKWREVYWSDLNEFFPDLEKKIDFVDISYPRDIIAVTGKPGGPVEGLALSPEQTGFNKPSSVLPVKGAYVVGDTAGRNAHGIGTQLACDSGIKLADAILGKIDKSLI